MRWSTSWRWASAALLLTSLREGAAEAGPAPRLGEEGAGQQRRALLAQGSEGLLRTLESPAPGAVAAAGAASTALTAPAAAPAVGVPIAPAAPLVTPPAAVDTEPGSASNQPSSSGGSSSGSGGDDNGVVTSACTDGRHPVLIDAIISTSFFCSLLLGIWLLYLVNWRDADIRCYSYKMLSTTLTIFTGVVMTKVIIEPSAHTLKMMVYGHKDQFKALVGMVLYCFYQALMNVACHKFRCYRMWLYVIKSLLAHVYAFAGIAGFGQILQVQGSSLPMCILVLFGFILIQMFCMYLAMLGRARWCSNPGGEVGNMLLTEEGEPFWEEVAKEGEDEGGVLILSLLCNMTLSFAIDGHMIPYEPEAEEIRSLEDFALERMGLWLIIFLVGVVIMTFVRALYPMKGERNRLAANFHGFLAMSISWCLLRLGLLFILRKIKHVPLAFLTHALCMQVFCVLVIIGIDKIADAFAAARDGSGSPSQSSDEDSEEVSEEDVYRDASPDQISNPLQPGGPPITSITSHTSKASRHMKHLRLVMRSGKNKEQALRTVMGALGIAVGLSWEMAFDVAADGLANEAPGTTMSRIFHRSSLRLGLALVSVAFVLPAWIRFIVPHAMMHEHEHQKAIDAEIAAEPEEINFLSNGCDVCFSRHAYEVE